MSSHGNLNFSSWFISKLNEYKTQNNGLLLVDFFDLHYYPAVISQSSAEDNETMALRFRSLKSLYDWSYVDESWIAGCCGGKGPNSVALIPRFKQLIDFYCPGCGLKLSLSEYNFGNDDIISSALSQVELFGIFAKFGLDAANRWVMPAVSF